MSPVTVTSPVIVTPPPIPPAADPNSTAPPTLTVTFYQTLAAHFSAALTEIEAALPSLDAPYTVQSNFLRAHLNIPLVFLGTAIASVEKLPELQVLGKFDPDEARDTLQLIEAFRPLRDQVAAFERRLLTVLNTRQSALAVSSLNTYDTVKSLARDPNNTAMAEAEAALKRDLGRSGPRKKKTDPAPAPAPKPAVTTTAPWLEAAEG